MHPFYITLGSLVEDSVQYVNLIKLTTSSSTRSLYIVLGRHAIYFLSKELDLQYDKINFDDLQSLHLRGADTLIIKFDKTSEWIIQVNDRRALLNALLASYKTKSLLAFNKSELPVYEVEEEGGEEEELLFSNVKKITFCNYYFYISDSFHDATFMHTSILNMKSEFGVMKLQIMQPKLINKRSLDDLSDLELYVISALKGFRIRYPDIIVLDRGVYNKKMNLNDDVCSWTGYYIYAKTNDFLWAYYHLRRLYIPPLLDSYQDIFFEFTSDGMIKNHSSFFNRTTYPPDSIAYDIPQIFFTDIIQANMDLLLYDYSFYTRVSRLVSLKVTYQSLINNFSSSLIDLLIKGGSVFDVDISSYKGTMSRECKEFINIIKLSVPGLSNHNIDGKDATEKRLRIFNKYLASHLAHAIDKGDKFGVGVIGKILANNSNLNQKIVEGIIHYFCHAIDRKYSTDYSPATLGKIFEICNIPDLWHLKCQLQTEMLSLSLNSYPFYCLLESGYVYSKMPSTEAFVEILSTFMLICDFDMKFIIVSRLLETYDTFDTLLLPIVSSICRLLDSDMSRKLTLHLLVLSTNATHTNEKFKDEFIRQRIAGILPRILINHDPIIVGAGLKLMINLTKRTEHIKAFVSTGACKIVVDLLSDRENACNLSDASAIIGQVCNYSFAKSHLFSECADKISNLLISGNTTPQVVFALYQLASCNFYNKYIIGEKVFPIIVNLLQYDEPLLFGNSLRLVLELAHCPQFSMSDNMNNAIQNINRFCMDERFAELIDKLKYVITTSAISR